MSLLGSKNINAWKDKTAKEKARVKSKATDYVRAKALEVLIEALKVSPQFSGNMVANWTLVTNAMSSSGTGHNPKFKHKDYDWKTIPRAERKKVGDREAITWNLKNQNAETLASLKWNTNIKLVNFAPQAALWQEGMIEPRPENSLAVVQIREHLKTKFRFIK